MKVTIWKHDVPDAAITSPDLTAFARLKEFGLEVTGQRHHADRAVLACRVLEPDHWRRCCGRQANAGAATDCRLPNRTPLPKSLREVRDVAQFRRMHPKGMPG